MANAINWFEIPTNDFDRAKKFYSEILASNIEEMDMGGFKMGMLPAGEGGIGGAIVKGEGCVPSENGTMVYLNAGADLAPILTRIEEAGGKVVMPKTMITEEIGYMATFTDTEGNRVALHSQG
jgi:predicted enzyme related to lactoylglutathione lyase